MTNIFDQFDEMICSMVLVARTRKEKVIAIMVRDTFQAAMKYINDQEGIERGDDDESVNRVIGLEKAASWLTGMAGALAAPGCAADSPEVVKFWKWFNEDAEAARVLANKALMNHVKGADAMGDGHAAKVLEIIKAMTESKNKGTLQ